MLPTMKHHFSCSAWRNVFFIPSHD